MIQCENCKAVFVPGTLFCTECGAFLFDAQHDSTSGVSWSYVHIMLPDSGRKQKLTLSEPAPIMIGRADPDEGYWPELDLTDDDGVGKGVSRRHALIQVGPGGPMLIDQDSMNGTWIDDVRLKPEQPYALPASCKLRFGNLYVHIFLE